MPALNILRHPSVSRPRCQKLEGVCYSHPKGWGWAVLGFLLLFLGPRNYLLRWCQSCTHWETSTADAGEPRNRAASAACDQQLGTSTLGKGFWGATGVEEREKVVWKSNNKHLGVRNALMLLKWSCWGGTRVPPKMPWAVQSCPCFTVFGHLDIFFTTRLQWKERRV